VRASFAQAVSGTDLIVGARTGPVQLMLYAVFRIGGATNNIGMDSVRGRGAPRRGLDGADVARRLAPRPYPVLGTTRAYFEHFRLWRRASRWCWRRGALRRHAGRAVRGGARRRGGARAGLPAGARMVLSHGSGRMAGAEHADKPFTVVGVLARTGTPVDRTVHVSLQAWRPSTSTGPAARRCRALRIAAREARKFDLEPKQVTARWSG
jgi:putative ABC transport system permease protein